MLSPRNTLPGIPTPDHDEPVLIPPTPPQSEPLHPLLRGGLLPPPELLQVDDTPLPGLFQEELIMVGSPTAAASVFQPTCARRLNPDIHHRCRIRY
jgi:hypothetical protein